MELAFGPRVAKSPFFDATVAAGVTHLSVYNQMYMPVLYGDPQAEYRRLTEGVSIWDVACQRQVELHGPDAAALAQMLCARDLRKQAVGQGKYAPVCDHRGRILNDPVVLKVEEDRWWLSIADGDLLWWARAIAAERDLDVAVSEPDVSPLAVQGPLAETVVASMFGDWFASSSTSGSGPPRSTASRFWSHGRAGPSRAASSCTCATAAEASSSGTWSSRPARPTASARARPTMSSASRATSCRSEPTPSTTAPRSNSA